MKTRQCKTKNDQQELKYSDEKQKSKRYSYPVSSAEKMHNFPSSVSPSAMMQQHDSAQTYMNLEDPKEWPNLPKPSQCVPNPNHPKRQSGQKVKGKNTVSATSATATTTSKNIDDDCQRSVQTNYRNDNNGKDHNLSTPQSEAIALSCHESTSAAKENVESNSAENSSAVKCSSVKPNTLQSHTSVPSMQSNEQSMLHVNAPAKTGKAAETYLHKQQGVLQIQRQRGPGDIDNFHPGSRNPSLDKSTPPLFLTNNRSGMVNSNVSTMTSTNYFVPSQKFGNQILRPSAPWPAQESSAHLFQGTNMMPRMQSTMYESQRQPILLGPGQQQQKTNPMLFQQNCASAMYPHNWPGYTFSFNAAPSAQQPFQLSDKQINQRSDSKGSLVQQWPHHDRIQEDSFFLSQRERIEPIPLSQNSCVEENEEENVRESSEESPQQETEKQKDYRKPDDYVQIPHTKSSRSKDEKDLRGIGQGREKKIRERSRDRYCSVEKKRTRSDRSYSSDSDCSYSRNRTYARRSYSRDRCCSRDRSYSRNRDYSKHHTSDRSKEHGYESTSREYRSRGQNRISRQDTHFRDLKCHRDDSQKKHSSTVRAHSRDHTYLSNRSNYRSRDRSCSYGRGRGNKRSRSRSREEDRNDRIQSQSHASVPKVRPWLNSHQTKRRANRKKEKNMRDKERQKENASGGKNNKQQSGKQLLTVLKTILDVLD